MGSALRDRLLPQIYAKSDLSLPQIFLAILIDLLKFVIGFIGTIIIALFLCIYAMLLMALFWALVILVGFIITYLLPSVPKPHSSVYPEVYPEFRIDSASVFDLETSGTDLSAVWNFTLVVANPDNGRLRNFDRARAFVYYCPQRYLWYGHELDDYSIAMTQLPPFSVYPGNQTRIEFKVGVTGAAVSHDQAKEISRGKTEVGLVKFGVMLSLESKTYDYYCDPIEFMFSSRIDDTGANDDGGFTNQSALCGVVQPA